MDDPENFNDRRADAPQDLDAENAVLGSIMVGGKKALLEVASRLRAEHFYRAANGACYLAALKLASKGEPIDNVSVAAEMDRTGLLERFGGRAQLVSLMGYTPTAANVGYFADIVVEKAQKRGLLALGRSINDRAGKSETYANDDIADAQQGLFKIATARIQQEFVHVSDILSDNLRAYEAMQRGEYGGTRTGFRRIDDILGGLWPGDLVIVAGRPAMGKTSLAMNIATNVALRTPAMGVGVFSLEMTRAQLVERMVSSESKIDTHKLHKGLLTDDEWARFSAAQGPLGDAPLWIDDDPVLDETMVMLKARQLVTKHPTTGLIVLDYIQLVRGAIQHKGDRVREVGGIANALKAAARECDLPIIAISQLNRASEQRPDKRPSLADLSMSGQIEADADVVILLYRPDYYKAGEKPGVAEIIVAKQRRGPTATVDLKFDKTHTRFEEMDAE